MSWKPLMLLDWDAKLQPTIQSMKKLSKDIWCGFLQFPHAAMKPSMPSCSYEPHAAMSYLLYCLQQWPPCPCEPMLNCLHRRMEPPPPTSLPPPPAAAALTLRWQQPMPLQPLLAPTPRTSEKGWSQLQLERAPTPMGVGAGIVPFCLHTSACRGFGKFLV